MTHKFAIGSLVAFIVLFTGTSCERNGGVYENELKVLGTFAQISIAGMLPDQAGEAALAVEKDLQTLDYIGYTFETEGELHQLNEAIAQGKSMPVSDGLLELIKEAVKLSKASGGVFNPATGELTSFWEFHCDKDECDESPYPDEVQQLIDVQIAKVLSRQPSMDDLVIDGNKITSRNRLVRLEFGDIIRGFALENGIGRLGELGVSNAMIDIGGSVRTIGSRGDHDWWIGIPDATGKHLIGSTESIDYQSVVTVRAFDKLFGKSGLVYRHVVDPRTGMPVRDIQSVTVMHDNAVTANVVAVSILIAGVKAWKAIADNMDAHKILLITKDGTIYISPAMAHIMHWKQGVDYQYLVP
jgi:thiamine biosynthesis lipoprotein